MNDYNCENGCEDGACIEETSICTDSDGGIDYYVRGEFSGNYFGDKTFIENTDACLTSLDESGDDVFASPYLGEGYCSDGILRTERITCPNGCKGGVCINENAHHTDWQMPKESYLMRATNFAVHSSSAGTSEATIQYLGGDVWIDVKTIIEGDMVSLGDIELEVGKVDKDNQVIELTILREGSLEKAYREITFDRDINNYFVASYFGRDYFESYLLRATNFAVHSSSAGTSEATIQSWEGDFWKDVKTVTNGDVASIGNVQLSIREVDKDSKTINIWEKGLYKSDNIRGKTLVFDKDVDYYFIASLYGGGVGECEIDSDCPSVERGFCSEDRVCFSSTQYDCLGGQCVEFGGSAGCSRVCTYGCDEETVSCNLGPSGECDSGCKLEDRCIPYTIRSDVDGTSSYCDIDGTFKEQKLKHPDGGWANCQNNYECLSNVCFEGECIPVIELAKEAGRISKMVFSVLCAIANPISGEEREQCYANFVGG